MRLPTGALARQLAPGSYSVLRCWTIRSDRNEAVELISSPLAHTGDCICSEQHIDSVTSAIVSSKNEVQVEKPICMPFILRAIGVAP